MALLAAGTACGGSSSSSTSSSGSCGGQPPCPLSIALVVRVFPQGAPAPVPGAFVTVRGQNGTVELGTFDCTADAEASVCQIGAPPGLYDLSVGAPGFETADLRADVAAVTGGCCPAVSPVKLDVPLAPLVP